MAALTYPVRPLPAPWPGWAGDPPPPRVAGSRRAIPPSVLLRRRLAVSAALLVLLAALVATSIAGARVVAGLLGSAPPASEQAVLPAPPAAPRLTHVVQPGDTLWQIARQVQPRGDVRPLVDRMSGARHGRALQVGEVISVP